MKRLDKTEIIFKIIAYTLTTLFAIAAIYPFIYVISASISGIKPVDGGEIVLLPKEIQFEAINYVISNKMYWITYANTLFYTFFGTVWSMFVSLTGAYALSKSRLLFKRQINFYLVFTMWFSAGMIPTYLNFIRLGVNSRWGIVIGTGINIFNVILLKNYFQGIPKEIEEAATIDGASEFQLLSGIYIPMSKAAIATVTLFYGLGRWNTYFWSRMLLEERTDWPLQVFMRVFLEDAESLEGGTVGNFSNTSAIYAMIVFSILPIIIIYPYIQKYFAKGVNVGGVKE
ncbi:carbohydrate ABC transporter, permease protein [Alteracholeplasma palmae J233]|uniref:Carbohydrate ABC transporter, permease protein n=1 Tax=Alteracholeplasma palmae (strain ATCC 49389 / J233) TaxID=1318466 RepID=U4KKG0_ALTPJ|nr:carbohydrate ABC transporter permease [Alteracholeplasma palmae]CCV64214.1 carbohydrate ABC transporter, permease protein [Alteracholeplasma palmae J233]